MTDATEATEATEAAAACSAEYRERREQDWAAFMAGSGPPLDRWEEWGKRSHDWRQAVGFLQPFGLDHPQLLASIAPLMSELRKLDEVDVPPIEWLHMMFIAIGHLMSTDVLWSQVETFYVNSAPRIHRVAPFSLHFAGISATEEALYIGIDDGCSFREVRRQIGLGVPKVREVMNNDPLVTEDRDGYIPTLEFAYFTGRGDRRRIIELVEPYLDADLGEFPMTHIKMGRVSSEPVIHTPPLDVVAEVGLLGEDYRKGYHN